MGNLGRQGDRTESAEGMIVSTLSAAFADSTGSKRPAAYIWLLKGPSCNIAGCRIHVGRNHLFLVRRMNRGFDADTLPPVVEVSAFMRRVSRMLDAAGGDWLSSFGAKHPREVGSTPERCSL